MVSKNGKNVMRGLHPAARGDCIIARHTPEIENVMSDIDECVEKLLHAQNLLVPSLERASELLGDMDENKRNKILDEFAKHSEWTAPLGEQLDWARHNQDVIDSCGSEIEEIGEGDY